VIVKCEICGNDVVVKGLGRKPLGIAVKIIHDTLRDSLTVTEAATRLGCSRGYIYSVLNQHNISPKQLTKGAHCVKN